MADCLNATHLKLIKIAFDECDSKLEGYITPAYVKHAASKVGLRLTDEELAKLVSTLDPHDTKKITFEDFREQIGLLLREETRTQFEILEAFRLFDKDGNGFISTSELRTAMTTIGQPLSQQDVDDIIAEVDTDGNGQIDLEEFTWMMTNGSKKSLQ